MNRPSLILICGALLTLSRGAEALVTEPDGLVVPRDSMNGEVQLYTLFQQRGEPIDWQVDALAEPNAFSPLCGFTATFVLNQAGYKFGLAWYNETGQQPQPSDLHVLIPAGSPVGATFTGTDIKNDPSYTGGLVGFALVGGETHYTNAAYNNVCSGCNPPAPWITAVMYASKNTPNSYYVCFEDGATTGNGWNNDGDFQDDVFFITGVSCSGGGQPCDTGLPGICSAGMTECSQGGVVCRQFSQPAQEKCNGLDDDCNGVADDGDPCPGGSVCSKGLCVNACTVGNPCTPGLTCSADGHCVESACVDVTCDPGKVCQGGVCKAPCDDVVCPGNQACRVGRCVEPCAGVTCDSSQVCSGGICIPACDCQPCLSGKACDTGSGLCMEPGCVGVSCGPGTHCVSGGCVDDCTGAVCPSGEECKNGQCVEKPPEPDAGVDAAPADAAAQDSASDAPQQDASAEAGETDSAIEAAIEASIDATADIGSGGSTADASGDATIAEDGGSTPAASEDDGGCGCRQAGRPGTRIGWALLAIAGMAMFRRRSRKV